MVEEVGVVKSVNKGMARALNDLTGEVRQRINKNFCPSG